ncbi:hypothetical protein GXW74_04060 [Roseomonas eburnea]|uniref:Uncharacterized protein n=1 Tax=Neoroseomonas eburnea TaxID=1346889 RepID=A0A9X9X7G0_9PROT|nr:hypothetical protein [Neoroseomonas eburnea]MBR0679646.1 hypothetical protein [Neoroseomonas eburnea]
MWRKAGMGLAGAAMLAGCGGSGVSSTSPPAPCPRVTVLADGADLTRFRPGGGQDLASMTTDARLIGFQARCDYTRRREGVSVAISAVFDVERGPAATGRDVNLPWFIAVTDLDDTQVIDRQEYVTPAAFDVNVNRIRVQSRPVTFSFPADERLVENHNIRLSFQLTPEELALNRRRGPR